MLNERSDTLDVKERQLKKVIEENERLNIDDQCWNVMNDLITKLEMKDLENRLKVKFEQDLKTKEAAINHSLLIMKQEFKAKLSEKELRLEEHYQ